MSEYIGSYGAYTFRFEDGLIQGCGNEYTFTAGRDEIALTYPRSSITHRTIKKYISFGVIPSDYETAYQDMQLLEIGPALAQFLPYMAEICTRIPIAIDPVNYRIVISLLDAFTHVCPRQESFNSIAEELIARAETMLNPKKIRLYNMTLQDACRIHRDQLTGVADTVIEHNAHIYNTDYDYMEQLKHHLLPKLPTR